MTRDSVLDHYKGLDSKANESSEWNPFAGFTPPEAVTAAEVHSFELPKLLRPPSSDRILKLDFLLPGLLSNCLNHGANAIERKIRKKWFPLSCGRKRDASDQKITLVPPRAKSMQTKNCWNQIQSSQKPSNGDIWYRLSSRRMQFVILVNNLGHDNNPNSDDDSITFTAPSESSPTSLQLSENGITNPRYYYWDSGDLVHAIDPELYRLLVKNNRIILCIAIPGSHRKNALWSTYELHKLEAGYQDTVNLSYLYQDQLDSVDIVEKQSTQQGDLENYANPGVNDQGERYEVVLARDTDAPLGMVLTEQLVPKSTSDQSDTVHAESLATSLFIKTLTPGGLVEQTGQVKVGDRLLSVNGVSLLLPTQVRGRCEAKPRRSVQTVYGGDTSAPPAWPLSFQDAQAFAVHLLNQAISPIRLVLERGSCQPLTANQPEVKLQQQTSSYAVSDQLNETARLADEPIKMTPATSDYNQLQETEVEDSTSLLQDHETETKSNSTLERNSKYPRKNITTGEADTNLSYERITNDGVYLRRKSIIGQTNEKSTTTSDLTKVEEESRIPVPIDDHDYRQNLPTEMFTEPLCNRTLFSQAVQPDVTGKFIQWLEDTQNDALKDGRFSELSSRRRRGGTGRRTTSRRGHLAESKNYRQTTNLLSDLANQGGREQTKIPVLSVHACLHEENVRSPAAYSRLSEGPEKGKLAKPVRPGDSHIQTSPGGRNRKCPSSTTVRRARHLATRESTLNYRLARLEDCLSKHMPPLPMPESPLSVNSDEVQAFHGILENLTETEWQGLLHVVDSSDAMAEENKEGDPGCVGARVDLQRPKDGHGDARRGKGKMHTTQRRHCQSNRTPTGLVLGRQ